MGKGGKSNSNTYKYICKENYKIKYYFMFSFTYKYTYNLKYIKIWARHKLKQIKTNPDTLLDGKPPSCTTRPPLTFTGPHYELNLRAHAQ